MADTTELDMIEEAARQLWGDRPVRLEGRIHPRDLAQGYAIQDAVWRHACQPVAGYKIGLTSPAAQRAWQVVEPATGRLASDRIHRGPTQLAVAPAHLRFLEPEIVFVMTSDLVVGAVPPTIEDVLACVSCHVGIEICDSRYDATFEPSLAALVADNVNADHLVIGDPLPLTDANRLDDLAVHIGWSGTDIVGCTTQVMGNPVLAVAWLANHLSRRGKRLRAGMVVASGSCAGFVEVPLATLVTARFGDVATAAVTLVDQHQPEIRS